MALVQGLDRLLVSGGEKVRHDEDDRALLEERCGAPEREREVGSAARGRQRKRVPRDRERVVDALARRVKALEPVREKKRADAVVVLDGGEREERRQLGHELALREVLRAEALGRRKVEKQEHREVPLLGVFLHVRDARPSRHVPVDRPHVVAGHVLAHLGELHPAAPEDGVVFAAHARIHQPVRPDADAMELADDVAG